MRRFASIVLSLVFAAGCTGQGAQPPTTGSSGQPPQAGNDIVTSTIDTSVQVFLWGEAPTTDRDLKLAKEAGFTHVKQMFQWDFIEGKGKGRFEWNEPDRIVDAVSKNNLKLIARLDVAPQWARGAGAKMDLHGPPAKMSDYGDFAGAVAERYKGRIAMYQIWNEPNLAREWNGAAPSAVQYTEMLKAAYTAIKKADPNAIVVNGGLSPTTAGLPLAIQDTQFVTDMYKAGAKDYFDQLGVHGAGFRSPPNADPAAVAKDPKATNNDPSSETLKRVYAFRHVEDIRKVMVENGDEKKKMAVLEFGYTTDDRPGSPYLWHAVNEVEQSSYIVQSFLYADRNWQDYVSTMSLIYICAPHWTEKDEQYYWAITYENGTAKFAYDGVKEYLTKGRKRA